MLQEVKKPRLPLAGVTPIKCLQGFPLDRLQPTLSSLSGHRIDHKADLANLVTRPSSASVLSARQTEGPRTDSADRCCLTRRRGSPAPPSRWRCRGPSPSATPRRSSPSPRCESARRSTDGTAAQKDRVAKRSTRPPGRPRRPRRRPPAARRWRCGPPRARRQSPRGSTARSRGPPAASSPGHCCR